METFVVLRRNGWSSPAELEAAAARSTEEGAKMQDEVKWIRTYAITEPDGSLGTICIYQGRDEDAIRRHAGAAELPATEVIKVADTLIVNPDPGAAGV